MKEEDDQLYIYKLYGIATPRRMKATKHLRSKIGYGTKIRDEQVNFAQEIIDEPVIDFRPQAMKEILKIESVIYETYQNSYDRENNFNLITVPLSNIKGQAAMFGNFLATEISAHILRFLEQYKRLDNDALAILEVYCKAIRLSYDVSLYDIDTTGSKKIIKELTFAINRYNEKFLYNTGRD